MEIVVATKNKGKINEIKKVLEGVGVKILSLDALGLEIDVEEDGRTYSENAIKKAEEVARKSGKISLADDSGLEIDALNGKPGINSSRFAGIGADDRERNIKILEMMEGIPQGKRGGRFKCVIAIAEPQGKLYACEGVCEGEIAEEIRGDKGFGYDPIFIPLPPLSPPYKGGGKTFGELGQEIKNKISHRAKALKKVKEILLKCF